MNEDILNDPMEMIPDGWDTTNGAIIKVIGVGGGGNNAVNYMADLGITGVDFYVCNTDGQVLRQSPIKHKIQLGRELTKGRGAGCDPHVGEQAAIESEDKIRAFINENTEMLFITAGMGGGTGTGAAPVIARIAKEFNILTVAIVTLPFKDEGTEPQKKAIEGIAKLKEQVDSLLLISNNKLYEIYGDLSLREAFKKADGVLATAAKGIAEIITKPGYVNVDFADVRKVMKNSGVALMGTGTGTGEKRAIEAVEAALTSPLLNNNTIKGATNILVNITSSEKNEIKLSELGDIMSYIQREAGSVMNMKRGVVYTDTCEDEISVTIIATGFQMKDIPELYMQGTKQEIERVTLDEEISENIEYKQAQVEFEAEQNKENILFDEISIHTVKKNETENTAGIASEYKHKRLTDLNKQQIAYMEEVPAYKRKQINIENGQTSKQDIANETLVENDENKFVLRKNNSYLNPDVD